MTEAEQFAACDASKGNTMIVFSDKALAMRYMLYRHQAHGQIGLIAMAEDTRTGSGLVVIWRDRVPPEKLQERIGNCLWLLEETLAGRHPWPVAGTVQEKRFDPKEQA